MLPVPIRQTGGPQSSAGIDDRSNGGILILVLGSGPILLFTVQQYIAGALPPPHLSSLLDFSYTALPEVTAILCLCYFS